MLPSCVPIGLCPHWWDRHMTYFYAAADEDASSAAVDDAAAADASSAAADDADASAAADAADDAGALCMLCTVVCLIMETDQG